MSTVDKLAREQQVILCAGTGGVGKTTIAAAIGVLAAQAGRRVAVITVDPARRLADAIGVELTNHPQVIPGTWSGELSAMMLDAKATFDDLITREAGDPGQAERILSNRLYQNLSAVLSGTQEFMANEKLFDLHQSGKYDLIVVDTPPTRNALDFLEAPDNLIKFLDGKVMRLLFPRQVRRVVNTGLRIMLNQISAVVGARIVEDASGFLKAFQGMEDGFRQRAKEASALLASNQTSVVMVTTPRIETAEETVWFADQILARGLSIGAVVINRTHPSFSDRSADELADVWDNYGDGPLADGLGALVDIQMRVESERDAIAFLHERTGSAPIATVSLLTGDVSDLAGVSTIANLLGKT